jgi:excisionase family DNA binding protein
MKRTAPIPDSTSDADHNVIPPITLFRPKMSVSETAAYLNLSKSTLNKLRLSGNGPAYLKLGRRVLYDRADVDRWTAQNTRRQTFSAY